MIKLSDILYRTGLLEVAGNTLVTVSGIASDSRLVKPGDVFIAVRGIRSDGHQFIDQAIGRGAAAVVLEEMPETLAEGVVYAKVGNTAAALGNAASNFYGNPSSRLKLVGITGTNGKTTTATLLHSLFRDLGYGSGLLSTIENRINDTRLPSTHTTPDPIALNQLLDNMVQSGCGFAFMEVSSHAIVQERISGLTFSGGVFTNITHDHLDYHQTFRNYIAAKKRFFDELPVKAFSLTNIDDRNGMIMVQNTRSQVYTYALRAMANYRGRVLESQIEGTRLRIGNTEVWIQLVGNFNVYNCLAVYAAAVLLGQDPANILIVLSRLGPVEGRFERILSPGGVTAIVDYAHTPDALDNVLRTITELRTYNEKLITVVGAGGDRDRAKRPLMAAVAAKLSDKVILTSDNPRSEDPVAIIREMQAGLDPVLRKKVIVITSRNEAIHAACHMAGRGDIILVAGKGHEKYQEINGVKTPFDDHQVIRTAFFESGK